MSSEGRRTRTKGSQARLKRATTQATLKGLFQRTNFGTGPTEKEEDGHSGGSVLVTSPPQTADPHPPAQPSRRPKPSQLFPIFTQVSSRDAVISVDDTEVIEIPADIDLSTELPSSTIHQPSPRSKFGHATSRSPPPSPIALDIHCGENATSLPHVGTHEHTHLHKTSTNKESNKRTLGLGDVVPLPSSCSQHVRGLQHSYTFSQAPLKRSVFSSFRPSDSGTLDFLRKSQQLDDVLSTPLGHIHRSLTPQQCEEYFQSLSRNYTEPYPAFARISVRQESFPLRHAETWARRFRPRRANEVLGNEHHAIYLRDWLRALELHSQDRQPEKPISKGATAREKRTSKQVEPRGVKRPRVIRAVTKKRSNKKRRMDSDDELDDFVVFSDTDEEQVDDPSGESEDELAFCQRTLIRLQKCDTIDDHASDTPTINTSPATSQLQESARTDFADNLTNALLITGPHGCGKTAAVYACAEELGWEVFEVYPGIGRRNGASLDHLVGNVGRNHIVQTVHRRRPAKPTKLEAKEPMGLRGYLTKGKATICARTEEAGTEGQPISVETDSPTYELEALPADRETVSSDEEGMLGMCQAESEGPRPTVGQSLVLLEEVDVLFKDDAGFWPAVVEFIQCCQRPVVMTCNDPGLVPVGDLPLQKVLVFEPCPSTVAATFLQCLSLSEGCLFPHADLMVLYEATHWIDGVDIADGPHYLTTEPLRLPDLRRSITQLQMLCASARHGSTSEMHQGDEAEGHVRRSALPISAACRVTPMESTVEGEWWRKMRRHSELMSHVDAQLCRSPMGTRETMGGTEGDSVGYVVPSGAAWGGEWEEGLVFYQHDELIAEEAIRHSRGVHEECTDPMEASINPAARLGFGARVEYQSRMVDALQGLLEPPAPLMPQSSVFLDYIPWVRYMVTVDDILERRACEGGRGGRWTRNSMRSRHVRMVGLSEGQRGIVRESRLEGSVE